MKKLLSLILTIVMAAGCLPFVWGGALEASADEVKTANELVGTDYLPPIANQGSVGCCVSMAATYMQFSNAVARYMHEQDPNTEWKPATGDPAYCFSPRFTFNLAGSGTAWVYEILKEQGCPPQTYAPFSGGVTGWANRDALSRDWAVEDGVWDIAQQYRIKNYDQVWLKDICTDRYKVTTTDAGKALIKRIKDNIDAGNVVVTGGYITFWEAETVEISGKGTLGKDGDIAIPYSAEVSNIGGHQVSFVGYDDNVTCVKNGVVLKGAFKVANSWGTTWGKDGYMWLMYDAFNGKGESEYAALNVENRAWSMDQVVFLDWRTDLNLGTPELMVKLTVTSNDENSFSMVLTRTDKKTGKVATFKPYFFAHIDCRANYEVGGFAFNGTSSEKGNTAVMTFNYDKLIASMPAGASIDDYIWGIRVEGIADATTTVNEVKLVRNGEVVAAYAPMDAAIENGKTKNFTAGAEASGTWENGGWTFNGGMLTVYGKGAMPDFRGREDERPWADFADKITRVVIGYGVTNVGSSAFTHCDNLVTVICGKDVSTLGMDAFSYDGSLKNIVFHGPIASIAQGTVYSSFNIEMVKLTGQSKDQFLAIASVKPYNDSYASAEIIGEDTADTVGGEWSYNGSTYNCGTWQFADGVLTISGSGYMQDYTLENFTARPWQPYADQITKIVIKDGVTITGRYCFADMKALTEFYGGKSMNYLETGTFYGCSSLKTIVLYKQISNYKDDVVKGCDALEYVYVKGQTPAEFLAGMQGRSGNDAFANATITQSDPNDRIEWSFENGVLTVSGTGRMEDYRDRESERPWADKTSQITKVVIEDGVTYVGSSSFTQCPKLKEVICGKDVTAFGQDAFSYSGALKTIVFNGPITQFGQGVVYSCDALRNVTITNQTKEEFLAVASRSSYNDAFTRAAFTVNDDREPDLPFDLNGDEEQNVCDATLILNLLATSRDLAADSFADLDGNGVVTIIDVTMLLVGIGA